MSSGELLDAAAGFVSILAVVLLTASAKIQRRNADAAESRMRLLQQNQHHILAAVERVAVEAEGARLAAERAAEILAREVRKGWG